MASSFLPEAPKPTPAPVAVPVEQTPTVEGEQHPDTELPLTQEELNAQIRFEGEEAQALAQTVAKVDHEFPAIGYIDPNEELPLIQRRAAAMNEYERLGWPDKIRAQVIAHKARPTEVAAAREEDIALSIYIMRTTNSPLTPEDVTAKTTGKRASAGTAAPKPKAAKRTLDDILGSAKT